jgi:hypothetical protein
MSILDDLAQREEELIRACLSATGRMEEIADFLAATGVYARYAQVFREYERLLQSSADSGEALARATFLLWYEVTEPACYTGLGALPADSVARCLQVLDERVGRQDISDEFSWQLAFYYNYAEFAFTRGPRLRHLPRWGVTADNSRWINEVRGRTFVGRGQLSLYWTSIGSSRAL